jgi:predicted TIM-barrel fold metal-dependent hydrolase
VSPLPFQLVSADSHIVEPADLWTTRLPAQFRDLAPTILPTPHGDRIFSNGKERGGIGLMATAKKYTDPDDLFFTMDGKWEDVPVGSYDPNARLKEMDEEGIEAEVLYTTLGLSMFGMRYVEFRSACFVAFNDWLAEFCSAAPKRLFGVAMIPPGDPELATRELERCAKMGMRAAMVSIDGEEERGYGHPDYARLWRAAEEHRMPISLHVAASTDTYQRSGNAFADFSLGFTPTMYSVAEMIFEGLFDRHPGLRVISVENDAAWPLAMLERMDDRFLRDQGWAGKSEGLAPESKPSEVFRKHVACSFMRDRTAILGREIIGRGNIMWGSDYPHFDGGWPNCGQLLADQFEGVPPEDQIRIGRTNAIEFYGLPLETEREITQDASAKAA